MRGKKFDLAFGSAVTKELLRRDITRQQLAGSDVCRNQALIGRLADEIKWWLDLPRFTVMAKEGESFQGLVDAGRYQPSIVGFIDEIGRSVEQAERETKPGERTIILLKFEERKLHREAIAIAQRLGLKRPVYEDCLRLGAKWPKVQHQFPIIFLHDPIPIPGAAMVLALRNNGEDLTCYDVFRANWSEGAYFAFILPPDETTT